MKFGLEQRHWDTIEKMAIEPLKAHGAKVWIFGSRARGDHKQFSDVDLLYEGTGQPIHDSIRAKIIESLVESNLPIKVDLVCLEDLASSYKEQILRDRILI